MALTAKNIKRSANPKNMGGLAQEHYYAFVEDIKTWPAGLNPDFAAAENFSDLVTIAADDVFVMQPGKYFHTFPCLLEGGQVKSTRVGPIGSAGYEQSASFSNPDNEDDLKGHIVYIGNKPVIIIAREIKGTVKVIGNRECPAYVETHEIQNGEKVGDGNSQKHSFKAYGSIPSPTYLGAIPVEPPAAVA